MVGRFDGKVVLVTGGGRGMGKAVALAFAREGATVVVSARTKEYGEAVLREIAAQGGKASLVGGDISNRDAVRDMFDRAVAAHGQLDVVVSVAADNAHGLVLNMDDDAYDYLIRSNVHAPFWIAKDAVPHLAKAKDKGRLIFISSATANRTYLPGLIPYAATKAYLNAFARGLAVEVGHMNVLVNVVEPGMIASDRIKDTLSDEQANALAANFPVPRPGLTSEIAAAVLFLASNDAGYITGANLLVDGGVSLVSLGNLSDKLSE